VICLCEAPAGAAEPAQPAAPAVTPAAPPVAPAQATRAHRDTDPVAIAAFEERVKQYLKLHRELEAQLPRLSKEATPEAIDKNQRLLASKIQAARRGARQREFFTPAVQNIFGAAFADVFAGKDGRALRDSILDENPGTVKLTVNGRYPDEVPLSTMPPEVLSVLPPLEEDMEYRFVGDRLILLDAHAHTLVDFTDPILPK
jgi:hypothetical protein